MLLLVNYLYCVLFFVKLVKFYLCIITCVLLEYYLSCKALKLTFKSVSLLLVYGVVLSYWQSLNIKLLTYLLCQYFRSSILMDLNLNWTWNISLTKQSNMNLCHHLKTTERCALQHWSDFETLSDACNALMLRVWRNLPLLISSFCLPLTQADLLRGVSSCPGAPCSLLGSWIIQGIICWIETHGNCSANIPHGFGSGVGSAFRRTK